MTRRKMIDLAEQLGKPRFFPKTLQHLGERFLGFHTLNCAHYRIDEDWDNGSTDNFFKLACKHLNLNYDLNEGGLENIPKDGPVVIVANHPHGFSDGIMFGDVAMRVRDDIRIVVNEFLYCVFGMRPYSITVDVYGGEAAKRANMAGMRALLQWLREGHCVLVFPSGSAATYSPQDKRVIDDPWQANIASIIRKTKATVVPMYISGRTSMGFQAVSMLAKSKRAPLLPREIMRDGRMRHRITLGTPIAPETYANFSDDAALSDYLRLRTMMLNYKPEAKQQSAAAAPRQMQPIANSHPTEELAAEIARLPAESLYFTNKASGLQVYLVHAGQIPLMMHEIGVQRERTFRSVGEGSGLACDLDDYDPHYKHLIMWDADEKRLAGAYRLGCTDKIIDTIGIKGIYNAQFFKFSKKMQGILKNGIEMGRAFITPEYQRLATSLDTLWMGIGQFLLKHPQYQYMYGTVSISNEYSHLSRSLMYSYLKSNEMMPGMEDEVKALYPPKGLDLRSEDCRLLPTALPDSKMLGNLVKELEGGASSIPVLLRQYLRLNGKMLAYGIDEGFGSTLDCLVLVSIKDAPARVMKRYFASEAPEA